MYVRRAVCVEHMSKGRVATYLDGDARKVEHATALHVNEVVHGCGNDRRHILERGAPTNSC